MPEEPGLPRAEILLVEDNQAEVRLTLEALKEDGENDRLHVATDGVEAMAFLRREAPYENAPRPAFILLDLNMPRKDGREVLAEIKTDEELKSIPVVVMTTSTDHEDVNRSYELHANCFITKPLDLECFFDVVRSVKHFWLAVARLPSSPEYS